MYDECTSYTPDDEQRDCHPDCGDARQPLPNKCRCPPGLFSNGIDETCYQQPSTPERATVSQLPSRYPKVTSAAIISVDFLMLRLLCSEENQQLARAPIRNEHDIANTDFLPLPNPKH